MWFLSPEFISGWEWLSRFTGRQQEGSQHFNGSKNVDRKIKRKSGKIQKGLAGSDCSNSISRASIRHFRGLVSDDRQQIQNEVSWFGNDESQ